MAIKRKSLLAVDDEVYEYIVQFKKDHNGNSPTIREIIQNTSVRSTSHASFILDKLVHFEKISIGPGRNRISIPGYQYTKILEGGCHGGILGNSPQ